VRRGLTYGYRADQDEARQRNPLLRPDDVDDSLPLVPRSGTRDAKGSDVAGEVSTCDGLPASGQSAGERLTVGT